MMLNKIAWSSRLALSLVSLVPFSVALIIPPESYGYASLDPGPVLALTLVLATLLSLLLAGVIKTWRGVESLAFTFQVLVFLIAVIPQLFYLRLFPGDYRSIQFGQFGFDAAPLVFAIVGIAIAFIAVAAPSSGVNPSPLLIELLRSRFGRRKMQNPNVRSTRVVRFALIACAAAGIAAADLAQTNAAVSAANQCVLQKFEEGWRAEYNERPLELRLYWVSPQESPLPNGWTSEYADLGTGLKFWMAQEPRIVAAPESWEAFVQLIAVDGVPVQVKENGDMQTKRFQPISLDGFGFRSFVRSISSECISEFGPFFPISRDSVVNAPALIDELEMIPGYVEVKP